MLKEKPSNKGPYFRNFSHYFFDCVKVGDFVEVRNCLMLDPLLVLDFDNIGMTALHWAAKKGNEIIADMLIENHANVLAEDMLKRTPEYFATVSKNKYILASIAKIKSQNMRAKKLIRLVDKVTKNEEPVEKEILED